MLHQTQCLYHDALTRRFASYGLIPWSSGSFTLSEDQCEHGCSKWVLHNFKSTFTRESGKSKKNRFRFCCVKMRGQWYIIWVLKADSHWTKQRRRRNQSGKQTDFNCSYRMCRVSTKEHRFLSFRSIWISPNRSTTWWSYHCLLCNPRLLLFACKILQKVNITLWFPSTFKRLRSNNLHDIGVCVCVCASCVCVHCAFS